MMQKENFFRAQTSTVSRILPQTLSLLLAGALQLMPMLRAVLPVVTAEGAPTAWAIVLKLAGAAAVFGLGHHAVSAASSLSTPTAATVGVAYTGATTYSGGHASSVQSWQVTQNWQGATGWTCSQSPFQIAPGLFLTMNPTFKYIGSISGTPTTAGTYSVTVNVWAGNCSSDSDTRTFSITVNPGANSAPVFTTSPTNQIRTAGSTATFSAAASGTPTPGFYWKSNNVAIAGANTATFQKVNVQLADAATYTVLATNSSGTVSNAAALTVVVPPGNQTNKVGSNITFTVSAASPQALSYRWQFKGVDIAGATGTSFTTNNVLLGSAGTYSVIVSNTAVAATYSVTLVVTAAPPVIVTPPAGATITAGQPVTFSVAASGTGPFSYQWLKNNVNISGGTGSSFNIPRVRSTDAGNYTVSVMNSAGNALSAAAALKVNAPPQPLTVPPAAQAGPGQFIFSFIPVVGLTNTVLTNGSTGLASWGVLTNVPPPATADTITVSDTVSSPGRFYRVMVMP